MKKSIVCVFVLFSTVFVCSQTPLIHYRNMPWGCDKLAATCVIPGETLYVIDNWTWNIVNYTDKCQYTLRFTYDEKLAEVELSYTDADLAALHGYFISINTHVFGLPEIPVTKDDRVPFAVLWTDAEGNTLHQYRLHDRVQMVFKSAVFIPYVQE